MTSVATGDYFENGGEEIGLHRGDVLVGDAVEEVVNFLGHGERSA